MPLHEQAQSHHSLVLGSLPTSHADPVLLFHVHNLTSAALPFMKKHRVLFVDSWHERYMAVRDGTLFYADTADDVLKLAASRSHKPGDVHVVELKGCRVAECPAETDGAHWAFTLIASTVMLQMIPRVFSS